jgi:hypothetical protein
VGGAATEATTNYAFFVDAGASRFDGDVGITAGGTDNMLALTTSGGNAVISSRDHMYFNVDSNSDGTAEAFIFGKDRTGTSGGTELMRITEAGRLGIGVTAPDRPLEVVATDDSIAVFNSTATNGGNVEFERSGTRRVVIGTERSVRGGSVGDANNGAIAGCHSGDGGYMMVMGNYNVVGSGVVFTNGAVYPMVDANSSLGLASYRYTTVYASVGTINTSDAREKRDIVDSSLGLDFVDRLRPVAYRWRSGPTGDTQFFGLTAQDVDEVAPPGTSFVSKENPDSWGMRYTEFIAPMIKAIQELNTRIQELEAAAAE